MICGLLVYFIGSHRLSLEYLSKKYAAFQAAMADCAKKASIFLVFSSNVFEQSQYHHVVGPTPQITGSQFLLKA